MGDRAAPASWPGPTPSGRDRRSIIDLSTDNGVTFPTTIATGIAGNATDGSYNWLVPGPVTATARIRVRWSSSAAVSNNSGAF